jgi:hypothetical protein
MLEDMWIQCNAQPGVSFVMDDILGDSKKEFYRKDNHYNNDKFLIMIILLCLDKTMSISWITEDLQAKLQSNVHSKGFKNKKDGNKGEEEE